MWQNYGGKRPFPHGWSKESVITTFLIQVQCMHNVPKYYTRYKLNGCICVFYCQDFHIYTIKFEDLETNLYIWHMYRTGAWHIWAMALLCVKDINFDSFQEMTVSLQPKVGQNSTPKHRDAKAWNMYLEHSYILKEMTFCGKTLLISVAMLPFRSCCRIKDIDSMFWQLWQEVDKIP